jgi:hypothetical protein
VDLNGAVAAAGHQTRAVVGRLNDLHGSHASGMPNGGVRTERLKLAVDNRVVPVPMPMLARFMPGLLKESRTGPVGSFFSGSARVVHKTGRQGRTAKLETPGLTAGADMRIGERTSIGIAGGYVATADKLSGRSVAVYGAHMVEPGLTVDAVAGTGDLASESGGARVLFGGLGVRREWNFGNGLVFSANGRLNYADADGSLQRARLATGIVGFQVGYRIDYIWGTLLPRAGIEQVREYGSAAARPAQSSLRFGFTALHRKGGSLIVDHILDQDRNQIIRAALRARF